MHGAFWSRRAEVALAEEIWHNACKGAAKKWLHAVSSQVMARLVITIIAAARVWYAIQKAFIELQ
jgi:hypothetical protein